MTDEPASTADVPRARLAKVIARAGLASRRDAEVLITAGRVSLNGAVVTTPATTVGEDDRVAVDGKPLPMRARTRLWLYHKPRGLVTTAKDPQGRPTVFGHLPAGLPRVVSVGRLDVNTEGLLLLTNDGGLARVLAHPQTAWLRRYRVRAFGEVPDDAVPRLAAGMEIDGFRYGPIEAEIERPQGRNVWLALTLREGKNREVKRVMEALGLQVNRLIRTAFGPFELDELTSGTASEVPTRALREALGETLAAAAGADFAAPAAPAPPRRTSREPAEEPPRQVRRANLVKDRKGRRILVEHVATVVPEPAPTPPARMPARDWRKAESKDSRAPRPPRDRRSGSGPRPSRPAGPTGGESAATPGQPAGIAKRGPAGHKPRPGGPGAQAGRTGPGRPNGGKGRRS
jgi:23S rRNA pseudouridine2605 synthase